MIKLGNHSVDNGTLETETLHIKAEIDHASVKQTGAWSENQMVVNSMHLNYLYINLRLIKPQNAVFIYSRNYFSCFIFLVPRACAFTSMSSL